MDGSELNLSAEQHPRDTRRLRAGVGIVEPAGDALLEHIKVLRQHDTRLDHVEIMGLAWVDIGERRGKDICLLLVVAFQTDAITGPQHRFQERWQIRERDYLAQCMLVPSGEAFR
jgi:hypothetical protein